MCRLIPKLPTARWSSVCIFLALLIPASALSQPLRDPFGPFAVRDQFPIKLLFLSLLPQQAELIPDGEIRFSARFAHSNTYAVTRPIGDPRQSMDYYKAAPLSEYRLFADSETLRMVFDFAWRMDPKWELGMAIPLMVQSGGFLDETVEGFHEFFNMSNGGREETPRNGYGIYVVRNAHFWIAHDRAPPVRFGDVVFRLKRPLLSAGPSWPTISLATAVKLPTGQFKHLTGSGGTDVQFALLATQRLGNWFYLHYNLARTRLGDPDRNTGFPIRSSIISQMLAIEYTTSSKLSIITQILSNTSPFPEGRLGPLDRTAYEINAGIKYALRPDTRFEIGIIENLSQYQNTPDVALQVGLELVR